MPDSLPALIPHPISYGLQFSVELCIGVEHGRVPSDPNAYNSLLSYAGCWLANMAGHQHSHTYNSLLSYADAEVPGAVLPRAIPYNSLLSYALSIFITGISRQSCVVLQFSVELCLPGSKQEKGAHLGLTILC